jgi:hypothetical protein
MVKKLKKSKNKKRKNKKKVEFIDSTFEKLVDIGKEQGYLTEDYINKNIVEQNITSDQADGFFGMLYSNGVKVVKNKDEYDENKNKATEETVRTEKQSEDLNSMSI